MGQHLNEDGRDFLGLLDHHLDHKADVVLERDDLRIFDETEHWNAELLELLTPLREEALLLSQGLQDVHVLGLDLLVRLSTSLLHHHSLYTSIGYSKGLLGKVVAISDHKVLHKLKELLLLDNSHGLLDSSQQVVQKTTVDNSSFELSISNHISQSVYRLQSNGSILSLKHH